MDKQQQVLEMAKDICRVKLNCNDVCNPISACDALKYAERAVEAGYQKQREAKWIKRGNEKKCSHCEFIYYSNNDDWSFCPNCGARMKGGAE